MGKQQSKRDKRLARTRSSGQTGPHGGMSSPNPATLLGERLRQWWPKPWFAPALFALVALVYFWEFPLSDKVIHGEDTGTDFHKGKAPVVEKLKALEPAAWDQRMGGYPISEEIRHNFYPTYLIEIFTTKQRALGWRYLLAVFGAGWGMFLYLRQLGLGRPAALWAGLAYLSAPMFLTFPFAGQHAKMTVIALFPFLCFALERGMAGGRQALGWWVLMALCIALGVFSPHLQMLQYALLGLGLFFLFRLAMLAREGLSRPQLAQRVGLFAVAAALGLGLGAEGLFPAYLHVKTQSKRAAIQDESGKSEKDQLAHAQSWSLHPEEMASLVVPEFAGFYAPGTGANHYWGRNYAKMNSEHFGSLVVLLALVAVPMWRRRPLVLFLSGLFLLVAAFTLGGHTPVHWLVYHLMPGGKVLRTVGMAAFLFAFPAVVLAALALQRILEEAAPQERAVLARRILTVGGALSALCLLTALAPAAVLKGWASVFWPDLPDGNRQQMLASADWIGRGALVVALVCAAGTGLLYLRLRERLGVGLAVAGLAALALVDTWRIDRLFLRYEDPAHWTDYRHTNPQTVQFLERQPGKFRVYPLPGYGILSDPRFHLHGVDVVSAFNNYTLRRYDRLLQELRGVEQVFTAKFRGQQVPYTDQQLLGAIQPLLNLVNARYVVLPNVPQGQLSVPGFPEAFAREGVRLYRNPQALPWFQLVPGAQVMEGETAILETLRAGRVDLTGTAILEEPCPIPLPGPGADRSGDALEMEAYDYHEGVIRVRVRAGGARLLVISDNYHPHWSATIDGRAAPLVRANYVWKAVPVPAGEHVVELTYHSAPVALARTASAACALLVLGWAVTAIWQRRRSAGETGQPGAADTGAGAGAEPEDAPGE